MRALMIVSLVGGAVLLVPSGAHLIEMPHKMAMDGDDYFVVQRIYQGWALFGFAIIFKIGLDSFLGWRLRRSEREASTAAWSSAGCIAAGLAIFFLWVQPANAATANWSIKPPDWERLRQHWEYGHAAIAALTFLAFLASALCATRISWREQRRH